MPDSTDEDPFLRSNATARHKLARVPRNDMGTNRLHTTPPPNAPPAAPPPTAREALAALRRMAIAAETSPTHVAIYAAVIEHVTRLEMSIGAWQIVANQALIAERVTPSLVVVGDGL